jgi:signal transduction histidine kinase
MSPVIALRGWAIGYNRSGMTPDDDQRFPRVVSLACHDLRTPLATVYGFARTLTRAGELDARTLRFLGMIEEAAEQMTELLDALGTAARIEGGRWEPGLREVDTLVLATSDDERVGASGLGEVVTTDADTVAQALQSLAVAAARYGPVDHVTWTVQGRTLNLAPVTAEAGRVLVGEEVRDLGSLVALTVIDALGGSVELAGETLRVTL